MKIVDIKILRGPNYWSIRRPKLIQMRLDLEEMEEIPTNKIDHFKDKLQAILPGLYEHRCSEGVVGGIAIFSEDITHFKHLRELECFV